MRNLSYENEFYMQAQFHANQCHFHNGFALRLVLKRMHKGTQKLPIRLVPNSNNRTPGCDEGLNKDWIQEGLRLRSLNRTLDYLNKFIT